MLSPFSDAEEYETQGFDLYEAGDLDGALLMFQQGAERDPSSSDLRADIGMTQLAREEYACAERAFREALEIDNDNEDALAGLGEALFNRGAKTEAMSCFSRAAQLVGRTDAELMIQIGTTLYDLQQYGAARVYFDIAVHAQPDKVEAVYGHAGALHQLGDINGAMAGLHRALELSPDFKPAHIFLANLCYDTDRFSEALRHFSRTMPDDHDDLLSISRYMDLYMAAHEVDEKHPNLAPWRARAASLEEESDSLDLLLQNIEEGTNS